ncbi:hypothetical protein HYALB_00013384 [Hymenoscyphus albidus]|uniref:Uncharacterized protein n=1 Tax=Hymenoscyphus albidus TaxID=595503 RepID=A0A9N9LZU5_9HELO|nr:hypothetical protein HYALB_00013384 [Hymenoscyphus albidus]
MYSTLFIVSLASYGLAIPLLPPIAGAGAAANAGGSIKGVPVIDRILPAGTTVGFSTEISIPTDLARIGRPLDPALPTGLPLSLPTGLPIALPTGLPTGLPLALPATLPLGRSAPAPAPAPVRQGRVASPNTAVADAPIQPMTDAIGSFAATLQTVRDLLNQLLVATTVVDILRLANQAKAAIEAGLAAQVTLGGITARAGIGASAHIGKRALPAVPAQDVLQAVLGGIVAIIANPNPATVRARVEVLISALQTQVLPAAGELIGGAIGVVLGLGGSVLNILGGGGAGGLGGLTGAAGGLTGAAGGLGGLTNTAGGLTGAAGGLTGAAGGLTGAAGGLTGAAGGLTGAAGGLTGANGGLTGAAGGLGGLTNTAGGLTGAAGGLGGLAGGLGGLGGKGK